MNVPKPPRLVILLLPVVLAAYFAFQATGRSTDQDSLVQTGTIGVSAGVSGGENPLGSGGKIAVEAAALLISRCSCPQLPGSGPLSSGHVAAAWTDSSGQLLLEYENGIRFYYRPDGRNEEMFLADWKQAISEGWPGTIILLRQTQAVTTEREEGGPATHSAVITWLEGPYHLAMHGDGGQRLAELIQLAESLPKATGAATITAEGFEGSDPRTGGESADPASGGAMFTSDNPLGPFAVKVPLEVATGLIARCNCPKLPGSGPVSPEHVTAAYTDELAQIGLTFDNGVEMIYSPDDRTAQQFADQRAGEISDGTWPGGSLVTVRSIVAAARDLDDRGPAVVTWIEGFHKVGLYGEGGQRVHELLAFAESLQQPPITH